MGIIAKNLHLFWLNIFFFFFSKAMHSLSLCWGLSFYLLFAQLTLADNSLRLGNILTGDNPNPLSLLTASPPPDESPSNENLDIYATTEPSNPDGGDWGKAQDSLKDADSLYLASGAGNYKSDAGNTQPGRRRLRRANDFCPSSYSHQFRPSTPKKVSHEPEAPGWRRGPQTTGTHFARCLLIFLYLRGLCFCYRNNHHQKASYKIFLKSCRNGNGVQTKIQIQNRVNYSCPILAKAQTERNLHVRIEGRRQSVTFQSAPWAPMLYQRFPVLPASKHWALSSTSKPGLLVRLYVLFFLFKNKKIHTK